MDMQFPLNQWFALFVVTRQEDNVKERLIYRLGEEYRVLVPKRKLRERKGGIWRSNVRVLFPGYVLINGKIDFNTYYRLKNIPGLFKLLRSGYDITSIEQGEMDVLSRLVCNNEVIDFSDAIMVNDRVRIIDGPLHSMEGYIERINQRKGRASVCLQFLGEARTVDLGINIIAPIE